MGNCTILVLEREEVDKGKEVEDVHCEEVEDVHGDEVEDIHSEEIEDIHGDEVEDIHGEEIKDIHGKEGDKGEEVDMQRSVRISRILRKIARQISPT